MFKFNQLEQIHLEITNNCQASCPMCSRNIHGGIENPLLKITSWTLEQYKKIISKEVIYQVKTIYFCGNYGDPLLNNDLLEMVRYTVGVRSDINVRIHTNGSLRSKDWWKELATILPKNHSVIFAIDGLEDTNSIYRIGTNYNKIIENAKAFINAGGAAEWAFIRFKHNEHQVDEARKLAVELKFETFIMKDSSRFLLDAKFPVLDKNGETIYHLEPSTYSELKFIDKKVIDNYKQIVHQTRIDCHALKTKEIYIDAQMSVFPCCWLAMIPYQPMDREQVIIPVRNEMLQQYYALVSSLGGLDFLNAINHSIEEIINSEPYQTVWDEYWNTNKLITCARSCGVLPEVFSTPADQFRTFEKLND
jgi:MoaA/NifB/PqqE/SkfB family radical SAM enzyme